MLFSFTFSFFVWGKHEMLEATLTDGRTSASDIAREQGKVAQNQRADRHYQIRYPPALYCKYQLVIYFYETPSIDTFRHVGFP